MPACLPSLHSGQDFSLSRPLAWRASFNMYYNQNNNIRSRDRSSSRVADIWLFYSEFPIKIDTASHTGVSLHYLRARTRNGPGSSSRDRAGSSCRPGAREITGFVRLAGRPQAQVRVVGRYAAAMTPREIFSARVSVPLTSCARASLRCLLHRR